MKRSWRVVYGIESPIGIMTGVTFVLAIDDIQAAYIVRTELKRAHPGSNLNRIIYSVTQDKRDPT